MIIVAGKPAGNCPVPKISCFVAHLLRNRLGAILDIFKYLQSFVVFNQSVWLFFRGGGAS